jgi:hypothetical protein
MDPTLVRQARNPTDGGQMKVCSPTDRLPVPGHGHWARTADGQTDLSCLSVRHHSLLQKTCLASKSSHSTPLLDTTARTARATDQRSFAATCVPPTADDRRIRTSTTSSHRHQFIEFGVLICLLYYLYHYLNMSWKAGLSRYLPAMRFFACPESPSSAGVRVRVRRSQNIHSRIRVGISYSISSIFVVPPSHFAFWL